MTRSVHRRTPLLALALVLALFASACGDDADVADQVIGDPDGVGDGGGDDGTDGSGGRGWIDGAPDSGEGGDGGGDGDAATGERSAELDAAVADEAAPGALEPPIDPLPPTDEPLRAGSIDDADDVTGYLDYRDSIVSAGVRVRPLDVTDSTVFTVIGGNGLPVLGAEILIRDAVSSDADALATLRTRADGTVRFMPGMLDASPAVILVEVVVDGQVTPVDNFTIGTPAVAVEVDPDGGYDGSVPLDILFVIDATGSMGDEIDRLRDNMSSVAEQIDALPSDPDVRFGMTVYRDEGDAYVTRTFDLTDSLADFLDALDDVVAEGGGDYPEAMDEALADAMELPDWRRQDAVQLMFLLADAPPQVRREVQTPYTQTATQAAEAGMKIFPIAASGTDDQAEYAMRELAFVTGGRFVFLAYGGGDSATGSGTDITTQDFDELPLDQLVVRLVQDELAALTGTEPGDGETTPTVPPPSTTVPAPDQ
ncbi:MAG: VWA domain-containing protein [Acidimicrobiales bacterium]|nr:VWA domain-containing protein [Acidimicrobiales bacterium]